MSARNQLSRLICSVLLVAACLSLGSCTARTRYLTVRIPQVPPTEGEPLPLSAAVVLPDAVRNASDQEQVNCPFSTTNFVFQTGSGFEKGVSQALSRSFSKVEVVKERPKLGQYDVVIEPSAPKITLEGHCELFSSEKPTLDAKATVSVRVLNRREQPLLDGTFSSSPHTEERVLDGVGKAMVDMLQVMAQGLMSTPKLQSYAGLPVTVPTPPAPPPSPTTVPIPAPSPSAAPVPESQPTPRSVEPVKRPVTPLPMVPTVSDNGRTTLTGAGFAVGFGYVVTAYHLIAGMNALTVYHQDHPMPAALVLRDRLSDIALLKVDDPTAAQTLSGLRLGEGTKVKVGERVWVADLSSASAGGDKPVWREGRIRTAPASAQSDPRLLPLSVSNPIHHSGGPVLNEQGEVIGLTISPTDLEQVFPNLTQLAGEGAVAVRVQYAKWLLSMLPESEFILPAPAVRSVPVSTLIEIARPQVVVVKTAAR